MLVCAFFALTAHSYGQKKTAVQNQPALVDSVKAPKKKGIDVNPVKVWKDGKTVDGVDLDVDVAYENLENMVRFYYQLKDSTGAQIASGNVEVTGADYDDYKTKPNHARAAYQIVLKYLRLQQRQTSIQ
jgi:hypothetical protein